MVPVPFIRIEQATVDFNAKINAVEYRKTDTTIKVDAELEAKAGWLWGSARLKVNASFQRSTSEGVNVERTYSMAVHVRAVQEEMPAGLERILGILEEGIRGQPVAAPLKAAGRRALGRELRKAKLTLTPQERAALRDRLSTAANDIASRRAPPALFEAARDMGEASAAALKAVLGQRAPEPADLPFAVLSHLSTWKGPLARLEVAVTAMELKEATHTLQLELTVREDALEWTAIEIGGKTEERLVPE